VLTVRPGDLLAPLALAAYAIAIASSPDATVF
jgi:hypothetical protein